MQEAIEVIAKHDDVGTEVSWYKGGVLTDKYYVHAEDGDWRAGVPSNVRVVEHHNNK